MLKLTPSPPAHRFARHTDDIAQLVAPGRGGRADESPAGGLTDARAVVVLARRAGLDPSPGRGPADPAIEFLDG